MKLVIALLLLILWIYLLTVLHRSKLYFWQFLVGSLGMFAFLMVLVEPIITQPLARGVSALAGVVGSLTGTFTTYFKYGILFVNSPVGPITLQIDFECAGVIEIMAFLSLLAFFRVYSTREKILVGVVGTAYIMLCNALRIILICVATYYFGMPAYYVAHTILGRLLFYGLSILLYFYVFTKPQVVQMKVGSFSYGDHQKDS